MRKLVFALLFFMFFSVKLEARNFEVWRTTIVSGPRTNVNLTTATSYVYKIEVPTAASGSTFQMYGGTWIGGRYSTSPAYDTSSSEYYYYPLRPYASGYMFTTVGNSTVTVYWDYIYKSPLGLESIGLDYR